MVAVVGAVVIAMPPNCALGAALFHRPLYSNAVEVLSLFRAVEGEYRRL
jgi:hypothetical protein